MLLSETRTDCGSSPLTSVSVKINEHKEIFVKKDIHPNDYRPVVFEDLGDGFKVLTKSTIKTEETIKWEDGNEYPLVKVHISSSTHPFFTGQEKLLDMEGRVDRFKARAEAGAKARAAKQKVSASKQKVSKKAESKA